jgi:hypothetical protein
MSHDFTPNSSGDAAPKPIDGNVLDTLNPSSPETLAQIIETLINPQLTYLDAVGLLIEHAIEEDSRPHIEDFPTHTAWENADMAWEGRMLARLIEVTDLKGRTMALLELFDEVQAIKALVEKK